MACVFVGCLGIADLSSARAQQSNATENSATESEVVDPLRLPVDKKIAREIAGLIPQLGSPDFSERKTATQQLIEISATALPQLRSAYLETKDLEVRLRIEQIVHTIYFDYYVFNKNGFLGIRMQYTSLPNLPNNPTIPKEGPGLKVSSVIDNTGAKRAGLRQGDIIVRLDGQPLPGDGADVVNAFSAAIRERRPGGGMELTVARGGKTLDVQVTLGRCPEYLARGQTGQGVRGTTDIWVQTRDRFPIWWTENFRPEHDPPSAPAQP